MGNNKSTLEAATLQPSLQPEQLYRSCPADLLDFETTEELQPLVDQLGQDRVLAAVD